MYFHSKHQGDSNRTNYRGQTCVVRLHPLTWRALPTGPYAPVGADGSDGHTGAQDAAALVSADDGPGGHLDAQDPEHPNSIASFRGAVLPALALAAESMDVHGEATLNPKSKIPNPEP